MPVQKSGNLLNAPRIFWIELTWSENPVNTCWIICRVSALQSVVTGSISSSGDYGIHCWWDLIFRNSCPVFPYVVHSVVHAIPKWCTGRKWHILMASNRKKLRRQAWPKKWDKVKSLGALIDWCTGREWPVNCMTVISAWWRSNMPFQRLSGRLNYYITQWNRKSVSWRTEELLTRCGRESQQSGPPGLRLSSPGERERHSADGPKSGGQYVVVLFGLQLPLTRNLSNKVRGIFF